MLDPQMSDRGSGHAARLRHRTDDGQDMAASRGDRDAGWSVGNERQSYRRARHGDHRGSESDHAHATRDEQRPAAAHRRLISDKKPYRFLTFLRSITKSISRSSKPSAFKALRIRYVLVTPRSAAAI